LRNPFFWDNNILWLCKRCLTSQTNVFPSSSGSRSRTVEILVPQNEGNTVLWNVAERLPDDGGPYRTRIDAFMIWFPGLCSMSVVAYCKAQVIVASCTGGCVSNRTILVPLSGVEIFFLQMWPDRRWVSSSLVPNRWFIVLAVTPTACCLH
jgi:hypothetical protein